MADTILVVGGTGMLGEPVARALAAQGHKVRVLSRHKAQAAKKFPSGFELVEGDAGNLDSMDRALQGCTGVHISLSGGGDWLVESIGGQNVAIAASRQQVRRITLISGASTCEENAWFAMTRAKLDAENAVRSCGVPFTILRCTMFMETLPNLVRDGRAMVMGHQPYPWHWLAAKDYAAMVAKAYATPATEGKTLYVYGPQALTMAQAVEHYRCVCAPDAKLTHVPFAVLQLMALFPGRDELRRVGLPIMRYFSKVKENGDPAEAEALLGKATTTLAQWCQERAAPQGRTGAPPAHVIDSAGPPGSQPSTRA